MQPERVRVTLAHDPNRNRDGYHVTKTTLTSWLLSVPTLTYDGRETNGRASAHFTTNARPHSTSAPKKTLGSVTAVVDVVVALKISSN